MPPYQPAGSDETATAWSDCEEEPTQSIPVLPAPGGRARQARIIGVTAAVGVLVLIVLGFLLLGPQKETVPPLVPITSVTTPSMPTSVSPPVTTSLSPVPSETVTETETVTATTYVPVPAVTPTTTTNAPPSTTAAADPNDIWRACRQMHPHRWCNGYR